MSEPKINPSDYVPVYDDTVVEYHPLRSDSWAINPRYCLDPLSAKVLASFWSPAPKIYDDFPIHQAHGSPFLFNHAVPWFDFGNGVTRNAALLASYWGMPGVPKGQEFNFAQWDVSVPVEGQ